MGHAKAFHFLNKIDRIRDVTFAPGEGLVLDEVYFATRAIDDVKALVDLQKGRDVSCRNKDGRVPRGTPRIISTNWAWDDFWPKDAYRKAHEDAIKRRIVWVNIYNDLRLHP